MRLICPNCSTQYDVDAAAIPDGGREVQCGVCDTVWFQPDARIQGQEWDPVQAHDEDDDDSIVDEPDLDDIAVAQSTSDTASPAQDGAKGVGLASAAVGAAAGAGLGAALSAEAEPAVSVDEVEETPAAADISVANDEVAIGTEAVEATDDAVDENLSVSDAANPMEEAADVAATAADVTVADTESTVEALRAALEPQKDDAWTDEEQTGFQPGQSDIDAQSEINDLDSDAMASAFAGSSDEDAYGRLDGSNQEMVWTSEGELVEAESFAGRETLKADDDAEDKLSETVEIQNEADEAHDLADISEPAQVEAENPPSAEINATEKPDSIVERLETQAGLADTTIGGGIEAAVEDAQEDLNTVSDADLDAVREAISETDAEVDLAQQSSNGSVPSTIAPEIVPDAAPTLAAQDVEAGASVDAEVEIGAEEPAQSRIAASAAPAQTNGISAPVVEVETVDTEAADNAEAGNALSSLDFAALSASPFVAGISAKARKADPSPRVDASTNNMGEAPAEATAPRGGADWIARATQAARQEPAGKLDPAAQEAILAQMMYDGQEEAGQGNRFAADLQKVGIVSETEGHEDLARSVKNAVREFQDDADAPSLEQQGAQGDANGMTLAERLKERVRAAALAEEDARRNNAVGQPQSDAPLGATPAAVAAASSAAVDTMPDAARTLSSSLRRSGSEEAADSKRARSSTNRKSGRFPAGFFSALLVFGVLALLYIYHAPIGNSVPAVKTPLAAYVQGVDQVRGGLRGILGVEASER